MSSRIWIARDYVNCSGCRRCETACSLWHENKIWPEASRVRVFMLVPGVEIPHLCAQCDDAPCIESCPANALSINKKTGAITVNREECTACGVCIEACPGRVPTIHPSEKYAVICDLCNGHPHCVQVCQEGKYNALRVTHTGSKSVPHSYKLYAKTPETVTKELAQRFYGEAAEEVT